MSGCGGTGHVVLARRGVFCWYYLERETTWPSAMRLLLFLLLLLRKTRSAAAPHNNVLVCRRWQCTHGHAYITVQPQTGPRPYGGSFENANARSYQSASHFASHIRDSSLEDVWSCCFACCSCLMVNFIDVHILTI